MIYIILFCIALAFISRAIAKKSQERMELARAEKSCNIHQWAYTQISEGSTDLALSCVHCGQKPGV